MVPLIYIPSTSQRNNDCMDILIQDAMEMGVANSGLAQRYTVYFLITAPKILII